MSPQILSRQISVDRFAFWMFLPRSLLLFLQIIMKTIVVIITYCVFTYLVIVCKDGIELLRGQFNTLQTQRLVETTVIIMLLLKRVEDEKYLTNNINTMKIIEMSIFLSPTWKLSKKFSCTGRSLREGRILLLDTKVVNYSDVGRLERTSAGSVFQHLSREQKEEGNAYYLAISDRPNFPSPFRSNIRSYKVKAACR